MERWMSAAAGELGVADAVVEQVTHPVLDLVREVAHGVNRPCAPLSAFLVGLASGLAVGAEPTDTPDTDAVQVTATLAHIARLQALAESWQSAES